MLDIPKRNQDNCYRGRFTAIDFIKVFNDMSAIMLYLKWKQKQRNKGIGKLEHL